MMDSKMEWYQNASEDDIKLAEKVESFAPLFEDMLFNPDSITGIYRPYLLEGDDKCYLDLPDKIEYFSCGNYIYKVKKLKGGTEGQYNRRTKTLCVTPENLNNDSVILHEMIHLYEDFINTLSISYHDVIILALYKDLSPKIVDLDDYITDHMSVLNQINIGNSGGTHDLIFYLKSLSLDISMKYPLHTVMGYGYLEDKGVVQLIES